MNLLSLILRNLRYYRMSNLAVGIGVAVATAVLVGALMVGDSVRHSLKTLAVQRLGPVDYALIGGRFFPESLAERIQNEPEFAKFNLSVHPGILTRGGVKKETNGKSINSAGVQIAALHGDLLPVGASKSIINSELSASLGSIAVGDKLTFAIPKLDDSQRNSALSRRGRGDVISDLTVQPTVQSIVSEPGFASMFNPNGSQRVSRNAWLNLTDLQEAVGQPGRANMMLLSHRQGAVAADIQPGELHDALVRVMSLDDYNVIFAPQPIASPEERNDGVDGILASEDTYLPPAVVSAAEIAAKS